MMLAAPFAGMGGTILHGSWSRFASDLLIEDELLDHTADSAKDGIQNNTESLDNTLAEDRYKQNVANWRSCRAYADMGSKDGPHHWSRLKRSWVQPGTSEADTSSTAAIKWKSSAQVAVDGGELESQTPDLLALESWVRRSRPSMHAQHRQVD